MLWFLDIYIRSMQLNTTCKYQVKMTLKIRFVDHSLLVKALFFDSKTQRSLRCLLVKVSW